MMEVGQDQMPEKRPDIKGERSGRATSLKTRTEGRGQMPEREGPTTAKGERSREASLENLMGK